MSQELLHRIATSPSVEDAILVVAAHQDDETIGLGTRLGHFSQLTVLHLTSGAPPDYDDPELSRTHQEYTITRRRELRRALQAAGARPKSAGFSIRSARL